MAVSLEQFVEKLDEIGLLSSDEISQVTSNLPPDRQPADAPSLAKLLIREGKLTKYQATAVYQDKTKHLMMGPYVVIDRIGAGGMGQVLKAVHQTMQREVALKILPPAKVDSPTAVQRFHQEVRAAAKLLHPNIVAAHDAGEHEGMHFLAMEYVEGQDLSAVIKQHGQLPVEQAVDYIVQAAGGLSFAHEKGIVHRDIKPGNLLLSNDGVVKILDMGLARLTGGDLNKLDDGEGEGLTQSGQVMGTVDYMAPEQALDTRRADHRADIYALGCTLYRLLTGDVPFAGDTMMMKLLAHREEPIPSLREVLPEVSPALDAVYQRMMAKNPDDRQQSMAEVVEQLQAALVSRAVPAPARPAAAPARPRETEQPAADSALSAFLQTAAKPASTKAKKSTKKQKKGSKSAFEETIDHSSSGEGTGDQLEQIQPLDIASASQPVRAAAEETESPRRLADKPWLVPAITGGGVLAVLIIGLIIYGVFSKSDDPRLVDDLQPSQSASVDDAIPAPGSSRTVTPASSPTNDSVDTPSTSGATLVKDLGIEIAKARATLEVSEGAGRVVGIEFSPEGDFLFCGNEAVGIRKWDVRSAGELGRVGPLTKLRQIAILDDQIVASDRRSKFFFVGLENEAVEEREAPLQANSWAIEPNGDRIAGARAGGITVVDAKTMQAVREIDLKEHEGLTLRHIEWSDDGQWLLARAGARDVCVWDTKQFNRQWTFPASHTGTIGTDFHSESGRVAIGYQQSIAVLDSSTGSVVRHLDLAPFSVVPVDFSPSGDLLAAGFGPTPDGRARFGLIDTVQGRLLQVVEIDIDRDDPQGNFVDLVRFSPDGATLAVGLVTGDCVLYDISNDRDLSPPPPGYGPDAPPLAVAPFDKQRANELQIAWSGFLKVAVEKEVELSGGEKMAFRLIPPGEFMMGATATEQARFEATGEGPQRLVKISKPFYLGKSEVTQAQWTAVMGNNPSHYKGDLAMPVGMVSWDDIQPMLAKLNAASPDGETKFSLPTEAQWEYACRAGSTSIWYFGESETALSEHAHFKDNSAGRTHAVCQLRPNAWRLYDMCGNAYEWCADWYADGYDPQSSKIDPKGPATGSRRVNRGGSWSTTAAQCRSAFRANNPPDERYDGIGFRLAMTIPDSAWRGKAGYATGDYALEFDGVNDYVSASLAGQRIGGDQPFTIEAVVTHANVEIGFGNVVYCAAGILRSREGRWEFAAGKDAVATSPEKLNSQPTHLAGVWDGQQAHLFVDGKLVSRQRATTPPSIANQFRVGAYENGRTVNSVFPGNIQQLRISKNARYAAEFIPAKYLDADEQTIVAYLFGEGQGTTLRNSVADHGHGTIHGAKWIQVSEEAATPKTGSRKVPTGTAKEGLIAYWDFEDGNGDEAQNVAQDRHHGKLRRIGDAPAWSDDTPPTKFANQHALEFDGSGGSLEIGTLGAEATEVLTEGTFACWVKLLSPQKQISFFGVNEIQEFNIFLRDEARGQLTVFIKSANGQSLQWRAAEWQDNFSPRQWRHLAVAWSPSQSKVAVYLDGVPQAGESPVQGRLDQWQEFTTPIKIGGFEGHHLHGLMDEVRLYDRMLDEAEVRALAATADAGQIMHRAVAELNQGAEVNAYPFVSPDGLTIYWTREGAGAPTSQIWQATRASVAAPWQNARVVADGRMGAVSGDGLRIIYFPGGAIGGALLYEATRASVDEPFGEPQRIEELKGEDRPKSPWLSANSKVLVYQRSGSPTDTQFVICTRRDASSPWSTPQDLPTPADASLTNLLTWPHLSDDGLGIWFTNGGNREGEMVYARRTTSRGTFGNFEFLEIEGQRLVGRAPRYVAATGELFYSRPVGEKGWELWVVKQ